MIKEIFKTEPVFGKVLHGYGTPESPLCVAVDLAAWINHPNPKMMISNIDADEKHLETIVRGGQNRSLTMVTERGLYKVLYSKPTAKVFQEEIQRTFAVLRPTGNMVTTALAVVGPQIFQYESNPITFKLEDGTVMTNATEMAKPFGKRPVDWLKLSSTVSFLETLGSVRKNHTSDYQSVITRMGRPEVGGGTWMHEDVTMEYARWLSPEFAIWCNDRIKELLKTGHTSIELPSGLKYAKMLVESEEAREKAEEQLALQAPAVKFYDKHVITSEHLMPISIIAKEYNTGARTFNKRLKAAGIIFNVGGVWVLKAQYDNLGYAAHKVYENENVTSRHLYWTEKGFEFIRSKI